MIDALIAVVESKGYRVQWHHGGPKAAWQPLCNTITIRYGLPDPQALCALAHELGHAHYGDPPGHVGAREERADRFAARLLVSPIEYAQAEELYGPHPARLAQELGVTTHIIKTWQQLYSCRKAS